MSLNRQLRPQEMKLKCTKVQYKTQEEHSVDEQHLISAMYA